MSSSTSVTQPGPANEAAPGGWTAAGTTRTLAWAARSECILQERRGSTHKQPQRQPWTCPHPWDQLIEPDADRFNDYRRFGGGDADGRCDAGDAGLNRGRAHLTFAFWAICTSSMQSNA
jgi:hypothetical protein